MKDSQLPPAFRVGVDLFDLQHQQLIEMIDRLGGNKLSLPGHDERMALMHDLVHYALEHFDAEEELMRKYNYPGFEDHLEEHRIFRMQVILFFEELNANEEKTVAEAWKFLQEWIVDHILHTDMLYKPFFETCKDH